jgi:hypothetical protein
MSLQYFTSLLCHKSCAVKNQYSSLKHNRSLYLKVGKESHVSACSRAIIKFHKKYRFATVMSNIEVRVLNCISLTSLHSLMMAYLQSETCSFFLPLNIRFWLTEELWLFIFLERQSRWQSGLRREFTAARLLELRFRFPPGVCISVSCECCVLSGRGLCDVPILRPEESYRLWWVIVWDLQTSRMKWHWPALGCCTRKKNRYCNRIG